MRYLAEKKKSYEEQKAEAEEEERQAKLAKAWLLGQEQAKRNFNIEAYRRNLKREEMKKIEQTLEEFGDESDQNQEKEE